MSVAVTRNGHFAFTFGRWVLGTIVAVSGPELAPQLWPALMEAHDPSLAACADPAKASAAAKFTLAAISEEGRTVLWLTSCTIIDLTITRSRRPRSRRPQGAARSDLGRDPRSQGRSG